MNRLSIGRSVRREAWSATRTAVGRCIVFALLVAGVAATTIAAPAFADPASTARSIPGGQMNSSGVQTLCYDATDFSCAGAGYNGQSAQIGGGGWTTGHYWVHGSSAANGARHNCTTYAAYRLQQNGYGYPGWTDNANGWDTGAWGANPQVQVDQTPAVGAIAQWNSGTGHVAYVEVVTSTYIETTSDSFGGGTDRQRINFGSAYFPDNFLHFKDQNSSGTGGTLTSTVPLDVSASPEFRPYMPMQFTFTARNDSGAPASVQAFRVPVRGPGGFAYDVACANGDGVTLAAGEEFSCVATVPTGFGSAGSYTYWADWLGFDGNWHEGQLSGRRTFSLLPPDRTLASINDVNVTASHEFRVYMPLSFTFTARNVSGGPASIQAFRVPVRGPGGFAIDLPCTNGDGVSLPTAGEFVCQVPLPTGFGSAGTYTYWADWLGFDGNWHDGQLGAHKTFTLGGPNRTLIGTAPLDIAAPVGLTTGSPLTFTFTVRNVSGSVASIRDLRVPVRGPAGFALDVPCAGGAGLNLAVAQEWTCVRGHVKVLAGGQEKSSRVVGR